MAEPASSRIEREEDALRANISDLSKREFYLKCREWLVVGALVLGAIAAVVFGAMAITGLATMGMAGMIAGLAAVALFATSGILKYYNSIEEKQIEGEKKILSERIHGTRHVDLGEHVDPRVAPWYGMRQQCNCPSR